MKKILLTFSAVAILTFFAGCGNKPAGQESVSDSTGTDSARTMIQVKDSTIYGKATDCGMSTMALILKNGDTIYVERTSEKYGDGIIFGDLHLDDDFCMITREDNQSLKFAINLTQLSHFIKDYKIQNGRILLYGSNPEKADTASVVSLTPNKLILQTIHGQQTFTPRQ